MLQVTDEIQLYGVGFVCISACAPKDTPVEDVERVADREHPTGLDHGWRKADTPFKGGEPNPCECNTDPERLHWLLNC